MKLVEIMFLLNEPLPEWQAQLLQYSKALNIDVRNVPDRAFILFRVADGFEVPE